MSVRNHESRMSKYSRLVHAERGDMSRILLIPARFNRFSLLHAEMFGMADRLVQRDRSRVSKAVIEDTAEMSFRLVESLRQSLRRLHRFETGARLVSFSRRTNPWT
jgi:hypothetical protein